MLVLTRLSAPWLSPPRTKVESVELTGEARVLHPAEAELLDRSVLITTDQRVSLALSVENHFTWRLSFSPFAVFVCF